MTGVCAFDADVLICAATARHPLGSRVVPLLTDTRLVRVGSVLLLPEVLAKPLRDDPESEETAALVSILSRINLHEVDAATARLALALAASYGLRAADAVHLATGVAAGAERFITNNPKDFPQAIAEIDVVYPDQLPAV